MNEFQLSIDIHAPIGRVWDVTIDFERWPEWTPTVTRAKVRGKGSAGVGTLITIYQPKLLPALWRVTQFEPKRVIELQSGFPGLRVIALHNMAQRGEHTTLTLTIRFEGWMGRMLARRLADLNNRYLALEADGIRRYCEKG